MRLVVRSVFQNASGGMFYIFPIKHNVLIPARFEHDVFLKTEVL